VKVVARILQVAGILAILAAGVCIVILFELDFFAGDLFVPLLIGIGGGIVVGLGLIALSAVFAPGTVKISAPLFRPSSSINGIDDDPVAKP
jgi:hypothetical protein